MKAKQTQRTLRNLMATMILGCLAIFIINKLVFSWGSQSNYSDISDVPSQQTAIVLGAGVWSGGQPSPVLEDRLLTAIELYKAGKVQKLLLTGDHGQEDYDEVNAMLDYTRQAGIPEEDIFLDHAGFDTYDSIYRAKVIFKVKSAVVITQKFHLPRAVFLARALKLDVVGLEADRRPYLHIEVLEQRENLARIKAFLEIMVGAKPKYLGEAIPITGDGRLTYDEI